MRDNGNFPPSISFIRSEFNSSEHCNTFFSDPLTLPVTKANISDAKSAYPLIFSVLEKIPSVRLFNVLEIEKVLLSGVWPVNFAKFL